MRAIFTYPNNPFYIDPDYLGDDTAGFQRRIKELKEGTYLSWGTQSAPTETVDGLMTEIGKYYNYYDTTGTPNITRHDMWAFPLVELDIEVIPSAAPISWERVGFPGEILSNGDTEKHYESVAVNRFTTATAHGFTSGELIIAPSGADIPSDGTPDAPQTAYVKVIDATTFELYSNSALTENNGAFAIKSIEIDEVEGYNNQGTSDVVAPTLMRIHLATGNTTTGWTDGDFIQMGKNIDNPFWGGIGVWQVPRYVKVIDSTTLELYTDAALTTALTVTTANIPDAGTAYNGSQGFSATAGATAHVLSDVAGQGDQLADSKILSCWGTASEKRIKAYVTIFSEDTTSSTPGTFSSVAPLVAVGGVLNVGDWLSQRINKQCWLQINAAGTLFDLYDAETGGNILDFSYASGVGIQNVYWKLYIESPALSSNPMTNSIWNEPLDCTTNNQMWYEPRSGSINPSTAFWPFWRDIAWNSTTNTAYYRYATPTLHIPGTSKYTYQDSSNVTQLGAQFTDYVALPGGYPYTLRSSVEGTEIEAAVFTFNQNAQGQITSISTAGGVYDGPSATQFQQRVNPLPSQYVPPAQTPVQKAAAEDAFYLNDIWYTTPTSFDWDGTKNWPRSIVPASAELTESQPSVTTTSQAGIKYVRSGGFSKSGIELTYPPLNEADFRVLQNASQLAQGQKAVFRLYWNKQTDYSSNASDWIWKRNLTVSNGVPFVISTRDNDRIYLLEGMESNETGVIKAGQLLEIGSSYNGRVSQSVADVDANVFGEVETRIAYKPGSWTGGSGDQVWIVPSSIVVTLAEDDFVYTARTDGLYDVSVRFDFSWYHSS